LLIIEGHGEETGVRCSRIPTEDFNIRALNFIVFGNALVEAVHEDGHGGDGQTAECSNNARLGDAGGEVASQEGGFVSVEDLTGHVGDGGIVVVVHDREFEVGVGFSGSLGGIADQEADGDDQVAFFFHQGVQILLIVRDFFGLEIFAFDAELIDRVGDAFPGGGIEGFVIDTTRIGDLAYLGLGGGGFLGSRFLGLSRRGCRAGGKQHAADQQNGYDGEQLFNHTFSNLLFYINNTWRR